MGCNEVKQNRNLKKNNTKEYLIYLLNSYYKAKNYFELNNFEEKKLDAINQCTLIIEAQELLKKGNHKKIELEKLPKSITSEYITGYTNEERKEKINFIIESLTKKKEEVTNKRNDNIEKFKKQIYKINPNQLANFKKNSSNILIRLNNKIKSLDKQINKLKEILDDEYTPVPKYIKENEEYEIEVINETIPNNTLHITINNISYSKSGALVALNVLNNTKEIKNIKGRDFKETFDMVFYERNFLDLYKETMYIVLLRTYTLKENKVKGKLEIPLKELKDNDTVEGTFRITMESGKSDTFIDISMKIRSPIVDKKYRIAYREGLKLTKIYPRFDRIESFDVKISNYLISKTIKEINNEHANKDIKNNKENIDNDINKDINNDVENIEINENIENNENIYNKEDNKNINNKENIEKNDNKENNKNIDNKENKKKEDNRENIKDVNNIGNKKEEDNIKISVYKSIIKEKDKIINEEKKESKDKDEKTGKNENKINNINKDGINDEDEKETLIIKENDTNKNNLKDSKIKKDKKVTNEKIDKDLFKENELEDVDCIDNLNSLRVLEDRIKNLEKIISKIDGKTPKDLLQKKIKISVKKKQLEKGMEEGEIDKNEYLLIMINQLKHDTLLCKYLKQENRIEDGKKVFKRIKLLNLEIEELKKFMK